MFEYLINYFDYRTSLWVPRCLWFSINNISLFNKGILNLLPKNYLPQLYIISIGQGYRFNHIVSTTFAIVITEAINDTYGDIFVAWYKALVNTNSLIFSAG